MNWLTEIDAVTQAVEQEFAPLNTEQLNWKPNPEIWSIAQNIKHLIVVNETYFPVIAALKNGSYKAPFLGRIGFMVSFFGKTVLEAVQPDRRKKMKTFPLWEPGQSEIGSDITARFSRHQHDLKKLIEDCADLINRGVVISSPANRNIVYTLETAFDIIVTHEQRHLEQARELRRMLPASVGSGRFQRGTRNANF